MGLKLPFLTKLFHKPGLLVDYTVGPSLPKDAAKVLRHKPLHSGTLTIMPGDLILKEMPRGTTYSEYYARHNTERFCDVMVLDAFIQKVVKDTTLLRHMIEEHFGDFSGQIFFLGTSFESTTGIECVPFLNLNTRFLALRYMCPAVHPVNHDVFCSACFLGDNVSSTKRITN